MNSLDFIFIGILLIGAWIGFRKGLFQELITFLGLIIALVTAFKLLNTGIDAIENLTPINNVWVPYVAFLAIFVLVFFLVVLFGKWLEELVQKTLLGSLDKAAGAALGMVKYGFSVSVLLWLTHVAEIDQQVALTKDSVLYPYFLNFAPRTFELITYIIPFQDIFSSIKDQLVR